MTKARFYVHCGAELAAEASFCTSCGTPTDMCEQLQSDFGLTAKGLVRKSVIRLTLTLAIIVTFWSLSRIQVGFRSCSPPMRASTALFCPSGRGGRSGVMRVVSFTAMAYGFNLTLTPAQFANGGSSKANHDSRLL